MTCRLVTSVTLDYLAGALAPATRRAFEQHLGDCPDCIAFLNTYKKTVRATRSLRYTDIPVEMRRRVRQFLRQRISQRRPSP
jgi:anti-sigma factor RsiW